MMMSSKEFQNWLWFMLYVIESKNASQKKSWMVTREEFMNKIHEIEEKGYSWLNTVER